MTGSTRKNPSKRQEGKRLSYRISRPTLQRGGHVLYYKYVAGEVTVDEEKLVLTREENVSPANVGETRGAASREAPRFAYNGA